jgi:hypothetical protein
MAVDVPRHAAVAEPRGEVEDLGGGREDGVRRCAAVSISSALTPTSAPAESLTSAPTCSQCALLLTLLWRDWIELVFRVDPDAGNGALEWAFAAVALGVAAASGAVAHRDRPRAHEPVEQA